MKYFKILHSLITVIFVCRIDAQTSSLVSVGSNAKLSYTADSKGNIIPDFSGVGYLNSEVPIPTVAVVKTVSPVSGDNLTNIQDAINQVATMKVGADGFRGAILFKKGKYYISDTINIKASGIVLRGEGSDTVSGTHFVATKTSQFTLFNFRGDSGTYINYTTRKSITDSYVPFGSKQFTVATGNTFAVGNQVFVHRIPNQAWIDLLTMAQWGWTASLYDVYYERKVTAVSGNVITFDSPVMDEMDATYAPGEVMKFTSGRITRSAIENMAISSTYTSETDENHGWEAVSFDNIVNAWARNLNIYYFGNSGVHVQSGATWVTVDNCQMLDPKSQVLGERRYSFYVDGQRTLVQNCTTRNGRHDFVDGSITPGPNVFYNNNSTLQQNDIGPHMRWSTGILFDNITGDGSMNVQNRTNSGTGHGWAGGQIMFWNCTGQSMVIHDPEGDAINWAIGCVFPTISNVGFNATEPLGFVESQNTHITAIPSLFLAQLNDRTGNAGKSSQTITFKNIPYQYIGNTDYDPASAASSGLQVSLTSSDTDVATIVNGKIHIVGIGTAVITATQAGNSSYTQAPDYSQSLNVYNNQCSCH